MLKRMSYRQKIASSYVDAVVARQQSLFRPHNRIDGQLVKRILEVTSPISPKKYGGIPQVCFEHGSSEQYDLSFHGLGACIVDG